MTYTTTSLSRLLGINRRRIYRMVRQRQLPAPMRTGSGFRWPAAAIERFVSRRILLRLAPCGRWYR
jgi:excisionase family DNA binding protein